MAVQVLFHGIRGSLIQTGECPLCWNITLWYLPWSRKSQACVVFKFIQYLTLEILNQYIISGNTIEVLEIAGCSSVRIRSLIPLSYDFHKFRDDDLFIIRVPCWALCEVYSRYTTFWEQALLSASGDGCHYTYRFLTTFKIILRDTNRNRIRDVLNTEMEVSLLEGPEFVANCFN